ncbi:MAG: hypothetical protein WAM58_16380 [Candidatus Acidiferrum sp.]
MGPRLYLYIYENSNWSLVKRVTVHMGSSVCPYWLAISKKKFLKLHSLCPVICVMTLDKGWHFIVSFALIGFLIAMLAARCMVFNAPDIITDSMILVSPGLLLFLERVWGRVGFANETAAMWSSIVLVAVANGMMYAK